MIGGPPIAQPYYPYQYPTPGYVQQPSAVRPTPLASQQATLPRIPAPPVVRGQIPDEAPTRQAMKLDMPAPEALGVAVPASWTELRVRLDRIGATGFALELQPDGGYRFRCEIPATNGRRTVEGRAGTEAEAVRQALEQAGQ